MVDASVSSSEGDSRAAAAPGTSNDADTIPPARVPRVAIRLVTPAGSSRRIMLSSADAADSLETLHG